MSTCKTVPVTVPEDGKMTKAAVQEVIGTFLGGEWADQDPEALTVTYQSGYANTNGIVERPAREGGNDATPRKVFLKINGALDGEIAFFKNLVPSKSQEAELCDLYGKTGTGAKLYGFFRSVEGTFGRIDEFLDARNLKPADVENAEIRADIGRAFAGFHAMNTGLEKKPLQLYYDTITREFGKYHKMEKLKRLANEGGVNLDDLVDFDFASHIKRITDRLDSIGGKPGWCIHDVQFMNTMVRNNPKPGQNKVVLIDFEFVFQNYRALDIGGHFMQKMFQWFDKESQIADCRPYSDEEKRHFCSEYAAQWNETTGDADTAEQVFQEAELGFLLAITFDVHNMLCFMHDEDDKDPLSLLGLRKLFAEFVSQEKKLGLAD